MGLKYLYKDGEKACSKTPLKVELDGTLCGEIRKVKDGFQYYPKGSKSGGNVFAGISDVQNSLLSIQSRRVKGKTPSEDDQSDDKRDKRLRTATDKLRKTEEVLKELNECMEGAMTLIQACADLLSQQVENKETLNLLKAQVTYDETEADGFSLLDDLTTFIGK
jgi:hypothetical protein